MHDKLEISFPVNLNRCRLTDGFWKKRQDLVRNEVLEYQWNVLNDYIPGVRTSGAIRNFRIAAGESEGEFYGRPFQDSDVYKWLEAVAYCVETKHDEHLEALADRVIDLIGRVQQPDGYLDTFYIIGKNLSNRWTNLRDNHELYCAGHMIEAAVAYYTATGKQPVLTIALRLADHICTMLGNKEGQIPGYPGHEEIELALVKLYHLTHEKKYLLQASYFVEQRGQVPRFFVLEAKAMGEEPPYGPTQGKYTYQYNQSHQPLRQQTKAAGHAVRALYYYCGATDVAIEMNDNELLSVMNTLWDDVVNRQMYVTGAVGASQFGEAFTVDYDLPNDTAYNETCASVAMMMWAQRFLCIRPDSSYADILERVLYNGMLPSISEDGKHYFYVNPLEVWPDSVIARNDKSRTALQRQPWFTCACCPPNVVRTIANLIRYCYSENDNYLFVHIYANSEGEFVFGGHEVKLTQQSGMPWHGDVRFKICTSEMVGFTLCMRIPDWCCGQFQLSVNGEMVDYKLINGYAYLTRFWEDGDEVLLSLAMTVHRVYPSPRLWAASGKVAIRRGPLIYCMEEVDNGKGLSDIQMEDGVTNEKFVRDLLGDIIMIELPATRSVTSDGPLYTLKRPKRELTTALLVPYFAWSNRGIGEMTVYIRDK